DSINDLSINVADPEAWTFRFIIFVFTDVEFVSDVLY
ncbi:hypothetical protein L195_g061235, partial [Trifolium pratense]